MDTTARTPRRPALTRKRVLTAAGLLAFAGGLDPIAFAQPPAASPGPAARLKPPQPLDEPARPVVGRGAEPDVPGMVSVYSPTDPAARRLPSPGWLNGPTFSTTQPVFSGSGFESQFPPRPVRTARPSFVDNAWAGVKDLVGIRSSAPPPGRPAMPMTSDRPATRAIPMSAPVTPPPVYSAPPAYRWYGWGSTTPGANPYAPTGQSPRGSSGWFAQTGATPGAFPVPVVNPFRPEPGAGPPAYARDPGRAEPIIDVSPRTVVTERKSTLLPMPTPLPTAVPAGAPLSVPVPPPPAPMPEARGQAPIAQTPPFRSIREEPKVLTAAAEAAPAAPQPTAVTIAWQRSEGPAVVRAAAQKPAENAGWSPAPEPKALPIDLAVQSASRGLATVHEVRQGRPGKLIIWMTAANETDYRAAVEAISRLPQLRPFEVDFER